MKIFGAALPVTLDGSPVGDATALADLLLVPATLGAARDRGAIFVLDAQTGAVLRQVPLRGSTDTSPAWALDGTSGRAFAHDDSGTLTAFDPQTGQVFYQVECGTAGFDAAPVIAGDGVFGASSAGELFRHHTATGERMWQFTVTNAPLSGTPACDGTLLYVPADDGLHVVSASAGRSVRRFGARRPVRASPVVTADNTVFWGGTDGTVYGARGGGAAETLYAPSVPGVSIIAALAVADGALYVATTNGVLFALEWGRAAG